jgi:hypothetical protein
MNPTARGARRRPARPFITTLCLLLTLGPAAAAQQTRGTITGTVTDSAGAVVPDAAVTVTNTATNTSAATRTTGEGAYTVPFLLPGRYTVTVEAAGFKKLVRPEVEVNVGARLGLDLTLETGSITEEVTVSSEGAPLVQSETASFGQVIDRRRVAELPLADGNPFALARLAPGVNVFGTGFTSASTQPFSGTDPSSISTNGAQGGNEFTLDGAPNTIDERPQTGSRVGQQPPADAVQEFKVTTASFDAQQGHTAGASIDVAIRSGTNDFHGTLYEFVRNDALLNAAGFFVNRDRPLGLDDEGKAKKPPRRYNRFGATAGGPVFLPRFGEGGPPLLSGRDRTFFFFSYEGIRTSTPKSEVITVPSAAHRNGDFSALLPLGILIYDPLTARQQGSRVVRSPFPGNIIPQNRISQVARNYLQFFPLPNRQGDAQGRNNYNSVFASDNVYDWLLARVDHTISDSQKLFVRYSRGERTENDENRTGVTNGVRASGFTELRRTNNVILDHVYNLTPTTIVNTRAGFSRFYNTESPPSLGVFDPAALGFSPRTVSQFSARAGVPRLDISGIQEIGGRSPDLVAHNIYYLQPNVTKVFGGHSFRFGYDGRAFRENSSPPADVAGRYRFRTDFTRQTDQSATAAPFGQELAAFLLGVPASNTVLVRPSSRANQQLYHGLYFQDDWKATKSLTLNLGLRYEYEGPTTERYNRNLRLFDAAATNPVEAAAYAAASSRPAEVPADAFRTPGGLVFPDADNRGFYETDKNNFQPRLGFAYQWNERTVVRGGYAIYNAPFTIDGVNQTGFDFTTSAVPTTNNGLTIVASFEDPFPNGIVEPPGASRGLGTFVGQTIGGNVNLIANTIDRRIAPLTVGPRKNPMIHRYELSLQRELPGRFLVEAAYIGSTGRDLTTFADLNALPRQFQSASPVRDNTLITFLEQTFPNPFRNLPEAAGSNFFTSSTLQRQQFLRPFPQFQSIFVQRHDGRSRFDSGQLKVERRFAQGFSVQMSYVFSKFFEEITRLNPSDEEFEKRLAEADSPHRFTLSGIYELPFGRGKRWGGEAGRLADALIGGYQLNFIYAYQRGTPLTLGNVFFNGDPRRLRVSYEGATAGNVLSDTTGFFTLPDGTVVSRTDARINLAQNIRTLPSRLANLRTDSFNNLDFSLHKNIRFTETTRLQLRAELFNAFNYTYFGTPNLDPRSASFGSLSEQVNLPRELQLGVKFIW